MYSFTVVNDYMSIYTHSIGNVAISLCSKLVYGGGQKSSKSCLRSMCMAPSLMLLTVKIFNNILMEVIEKWNLVIGLTHSVQSGYNQHLMSIQPPTTTNLHVPLEVEKTSRTIKMKAEELTKGAFLISIRLLYLNYIYPRYFKRKKNHKILK